MRRLKIMSDETLNIYLTETAQGFQSHRKLAERAFDQLSDEDFFRKIDGESNSVAEICKHLGGNLRSRWTDFLTTDGEKDDRNRDAEFVAESDTRTGILEVWNLGWHALFAAFEILQIEDLTKIIQIRGEDFTVLRAVTRSSLHTAMHVGQIIFLAKHLRLNDWQTLSVPKNKSAEFTEWLKTKDDKGNYLDATGEFAKENSQ